MTDHEPGSSGTSLGGTIKDQVQGAQRAFGSASSDFSEKAREIADDAKEAAARKAAETKSGLTGQMKSFGSAFQAASDHLSDNGQPAASRLLGEAAAGIDRFASSLQDKSVVQIVEDLRRLGRDNPGGLFATSMLAGLILGRVIRSGGSGSTTGSATGSGSDQPTGSEGSSGEGQTGLDTQPPPPTATSGYAL